MTLVTFLSDFGNEDHYVSAVKATIFKEAPDLRVIDISHQINAFDVGHAAYVLSHAFRNFPEGTVHLVAVDPSDKRDMTAVALKLENHYFVGIDSGIFSLISEEMPEKIIELPRVDSNFLAKDQFASVCARLATGTGLDSLGNSLKETKKLFNRAPKLTKKEIVGNVIRVDKYGNLVTNIQRTDFDKIQKINGGVTYIIQFGRERFRSFHERYSDAEPGDCYLLFNSDGKLQIGINKGNASELLGLRLDAPVYIEFNI